MGEFDDLIEEFVTESREHIADIEDDLIKIEAEMEKIDPDVINRVFRAAHSIKGSAKFLDLINIGDLAHVMEDVLNLIRSGKLVATHDVASPLLQAADMLKMMFEDVTASNEMDISEHVSALKNILEGQGSAKAASGKTNKAATAIKPFDVDGQLIKTKLSQGQVYVVTAEADQNEALYKSISDMGEILASQEDSSQVAFLFSSIIEANLVPAFLNVDEKNITGVTEDMVAKLVNETASEPVKAKPTPPPQAKPKPAAAPQPAAKPKVEEEVEKVESSSFITFTLQNETYAVPIQMVEEIIGIQDISLLPNVPDFVKGVINLRGDMVPIMDLRLKFGIAERPWDTTTVFLIVRAGERVIGMVVDQVSDVLVIDYKEIQKTPAFSAGIATECINGVYKDPQGQMVILVNVDALINPEEWIVEKAAV